MSPEDIRKLLGGYATGTLTEEERRTLFEAALTDQDLFNELSRDQELQELIADPAARRALLRALPEPERPRLSLGWRWALAGSLAAAAVVAIVIVRSSAPQPKPEPVLMAKRQELSAPQAPQPARKAVVKQDAVAAPAAQPAEVTAAVPTLSSEEPALADASQSRAAPMMARSAIGVAQFAARAPSQASIIPYRILRGSIEGGYAEVDSQTEFQAADLVRVVFEPSESGRLQVTSGSAGAKVLLDTPATSGGAYSVDVPPEEQKLVVTFSRDQGAPPVTAEIAIRRQSPPR